MVFIFKGPLKYYDIYVFYDFDWPGNCNLIIIKVLMLFLSGGVQCAQ